MSYAISELAILFEMLLNEKDIIYIKQKGDSIVAHVAGNYDFDKVSFDKAYKEDMYDLREPLYIRVVLYENNNIIYIYEKEYDEDAKYALDSLWNRLQVIETRMKDERIIGVIASAEVQDKLEKIWYFDCPVCKKQSRHFEEIKKGIEIVCPVCRTLIEVES